MNERKAHFSTSSFSTIAKSIPKKKHIEKKKNFLMKNRLTKNGNFNLEDISFYCHDVCAYAFLLPFFGENNTNKNTHQKNTEKFKLSYRSINNFYNFWLNECLMI